MQQSSDAAMNAASVAKMASANPSAKGFSMNSFRSADSIASPIDTQAGNAIRQTSANANALMDSANVQSAERIRTATLEARENENPVSTSSSWLKNRIFR